MKTRWTGSVYLTERLLAYAGPVGRTGLHAHHAIQIAVGLEGPFRLRDALGRIGSGQAAVVPSDVAHAIVDPASSVVMLYVNPDDVVGRRLSGLAIRENASAWFADDWGAAWRIAHAC